MHPYATTEKKECEWSGMDRTCVRLPKNTLGRWVEFKLISYEHEECEFDIDPVSLEGFRQQE